MASKVAKPKPSQVKRQKTLSATLAPGGSESDAASVGPSPIPPKLSPIRTTPSAAGLRQPSNGGSEGAPEASAMNSTPSVTGPAKQPAVKSAAVDDRPCTHKELHQGLLNLKKVQAENMAKLSSKLKHDLQKDLEEKLHEDMRVLLNDFRETVVEEVLEALARRPAALAAAQGPAAELDQLRFKAERAELELKWTRSELELQAVRPELTLRALRAERDLLREEDAPTKVWKSPVTQPKNMLVLGRYEVLRDDIIGQGGFSVVRRGRDLETGAEVAVKTYWDMEDSECPQEDWIFEKFQHEIGIFQRLHTEEDLQANILRQKEAQKSAKRASWFVPDEVGDNGVAQSMQAFAEVPPPADLFVRLLDYSRDASGQPGPRPGDGDVCYAVLELADYTLHEYLDGRRREGLFLSEDEVFFLFRQLTQMILVLHSKSFVHIDLKPMNIMHFPSGHWKLIDMDGMVWPGRATACDVCYTPYYVAPEISMQFARSLDVVDTSRHLDVWSLGMCGCELVTMCPVLEAKFNEMWQQDASAVPFLNWLADPAVPIEIPSQVQLMDPQLADVIQCMLQKIPELRVSMVEVLVHPYFTSRRVGGDWASAERRNLDDRKLVRQYVSRVTTRTAGCLDNAGVVALAAVDRGLLPDFSGVHDKRHEQPMLRKRVSLLTEMVLPVAVEPAPERPPLLRCADRDFSDM